MSRQIKIKDNIKEIVRSDDFKKYPHFFLYDQESIKEQIEQIQKYAIKNVKVYYTMKANPNSDLLGYIRSFPFIKGVEISSSGELTKALSYFSSDQIIHTGPGKTTYELSLSILNKVQLISIESQLESYRISNLASENKIPNVDILIRINTNYYLKGALINMSGVPTQFGIDEDEILYVINKVAKLRSITIKGFHVFSASGVLNYLSLVDYVRYIFSLVKKIERKLNKCFEIIDFGGGFGIDYSENKQKFNVRLFFAKLKKLIKEFNYHNKKLILELGRFIVGESGYYVAEILDIKRIKGHTHMIVSGGSNHLKLLRKHPISVISLNKKKMFKNQQSINNEEVDICGPLCFTGDRFAERLRVRRANVGDLVVVSKVGAYGYSVASVDFSSHQRAYEYIRRSSARMRHRGF